jgi:hypothetical protein
MSHDTRASLRSLSVVTLHSDTQESKDTKVKALGAHGLAESLSITPNVFAL